MAWAMVGAAAVSTVGGALLGGASGGSSQGGTQTMNKDPWAPAQDWMKSNLATGQNLQNYYQRNPFNQQQQAAYGNLASGADYMNRLTPGLLQQFSQPAAFDRANPRAMPSPFSFMAPDNPQNAHQYGGMMSPSMPQRGDMNQNQNPYANGGVQQSAQAGMPDIQKMVNDALAAQQQYTQPIDTNIGGGGNGG